MHSPSSQSCETTRSKAVSDLGVFVVVVKFTLQTFPEHLTFLNATGNEYMEMKFYNSL